MAERHSEWVQLDDLMDHYAAQEAHAAIELAYGSNYAWSAELRVTLEPNQDGRPDRSVVFFSAGGCCAEECIAAVIADAQAWQREVAVPAVSVDA